MRLGDNPIFLTQKRLTHRGGIWAAILISALVGLSLLAGLFAQLGDPRAILSRTPQEAGKLFYGWALGIEAVILVLGGFLKIVRVLTDDRKAGLWDSNRLTPLSPARLLLGYWLGSPLRECYMAATFAGIGLVIVVVGKLPLSLWLGTQILLVTTALFFGLIALLIGMAFERPQNGIGLFLPLGLLYAFSTATPKYSIFQFFVPIYATVRLFFNSPEAIDRLGSDWLAGPEMFGLHVPSAAMSLVLQVVVGLLFWRAALRKTANPSSPMLLRGEAVALFALLALLQHALLWSVWSGNYPAQHDRQRYYHDNLLLFVHAASMLVGVFLLAIASPLPEHVRVEALRARTGGLRLLLSRSALPLALGLGAITGLASSPHFMFSFREHGLAWVLATANLLVFFSMFCLLLEYCRLRFRHRSLGFVALGLFVVCVLPLILAALFTSETLADFSFLTPGILALLAPSHPDQSFRLLGTLAQFGVVSLLFLAWWREWRRLFARAASGHAPR